MAIMSDTEFDQTGELVDETEEAQEEVRPRRSRKVKFGIIEVAENSGDNGTDGQPEPEAGTGGGPKPQDPSGQNYGNGEAPLGPEGSLSQVRPVEPSGLATNPSLSGNVTGNDDENVTEDTAENEETDEATDTEDFRQRQEPPVVDRDARRAMIRTENTEAARATVKWTNSKAAKLQ